MLRVLYEVLLTIFFGGAGAEESYCVAQVGLELVTIILPRSPVNSCWSQNCFGLKPAIWHKLI